ncbi:hypothetical protein M5D96_011284 [Drosophila gunungcola]|uniref:Uncharacterized protein n=1 Tax=Drosophila gunungcola TaxID=103775 RepID=A0A9P9YF72_9MUSC|nr:hypothetical protein M5D96_011284 [Drosophila gunungcola]
METTAIKQHVRIYANCETAKESEPQKQQVRSWGSAAAVRATCLP